MASPLLAVQTQGLRQLARDMTLIDPSMRAELSKSLKAAGQVVADDAERRVSWSRHIGSSVRVTGGPTSVTVRAGGRRAPMAYAFEAPDGKPVAHPVFAGGRHHAPRSKWTWVKQSPRPFLRPALEGNVDQVAETLADSVEAACRAAGFRVGG